MIARVQFCCFLLLFCWNPQIVSDTRDHSEAKCRFRFASGTRLKLTKTNLAKFAYPEGKAEHILYDEDIAGFGIRMHPSGRRTWFVQFRIGSKQRRMTLGTLDKVDPDEARRRARDALAKAQLGNDPQAEKVEKQAQASSTLKLVAETYLERYASKRLKPRTLVEVKRHLRSHWSPLSAIGVDSVTRAAVSKRLGEIAEQNGPFAANRARAALSAMYSWAIGEGLAHINPVAGTHRATEEVSRERVLTSDELALVWTHAGHGDFGAIVRLLILTGARREEVGAMRWSEVSADTWRLPAERSKNRQAHNVPLSSEALAVLGELTRQEDRDLIFGSRTGPFQGWSGSKSRLDGQMLAALKKKNGNAAKLMPWRLHDLRRTAATRMVDLGVLPHIVEAVLNHISGHRGGVAGVYNRATYDPEKRAALALWGEHVGKQLAPNA